MKEKTQGFKKWIDKKVNSNNNLNNSEEVNSTKQDIMSAKNEILEAFTHFLAEFQEDKLNYSDLSESQLAIINATKLDLGIPVKSGEFYLVKNASRTRVHLMFHSISDFQSAKGTTSVSLANGVTKIFSWDEFPQVKFHHKNIDIGTALMNLSNLTSLAFRTTTEERISILESLLPSIEELFLIMDKGENLNSYQDQSSKVEILDKDAV